MVADLYKDVVYKLEKRDSLTIDAIELEQKGFAKLTSLRCLARTGVYIIEGKNSFDKTISNADWGNHGFNSRRETIIIW